MLLQATMLFSLLTYSGISGRCAASLDLKPSLEESERRIRMSL